MLNNSIGIQSLNTKQALENAVINAHVINGKHAENESRQETFERVFHFLKWDTPKKEYNENDVEQFILDSYVNITKGIIKKMATGVIKKTCKNGTIKYLPHSCYQSASNIINEKGAIIDKFFFDDLSQEIFITMFENCDMIKYVPDTKTFDISDIILDCYRSIRTYLYNNKQKQDNAEIDIIDYNEENDEFITMAVNTLDYRRYAIQEYNSTVNSDLELLTICGLVLDYIKKTEKSFIYEKCKNVLTGLLKGYSNQEIKTAYEISVNSVTKYRKILNNAYYEIYKKPIEKIDNESTCYTDYYASYGKMSIDFEDHTPHNYNVAFDGYFNKVFNANYDLTTVRIDSLEHVQGIVENYIFNGEYSDNTYNNIQALLEK